VLTLSLLVLLRVVRTSRSLFSLLGLLYPSRYMYACIQKPACVLACDVPVFGTQSLPKQAVIRDLAANRLDSPFAFCSLVYDCSRRCSRQYHQYIRSTTENHPWIPRLGPEIFCIRFLQSLSKRWFQGIVPNSQMGCQILSTTQAGRRE
jgi:hypothetical protein